MSTIRPQFHSDLAVEKANGGWRLLSELKYTSKVLDAALAVPVGFETDFASVPRLPLAYWLTGNTAHKASVVHDFLYRFCPLSMNRKKADLVFYEAMKVEGVPLWRRYIMYWAVRVAADWVWQRYRNS